MDLYGFLGFCLREGAKLLTVTVTVVAMSSSSPIFFLGVKSQQQKHKNNQHLQGAVSTSPPFSGELFPQVFPAKSTGLGAPPC